MTYLDPEAAEAAPSADPSPSDALAHKEAAGFLLRILEKLPSRQQEVIQLKFQNGLSYQEISEVTQLSVSHVGVLIHKGIRALREQHAALAGQYVGLPARAAVALKPAFPQTAIPS